MRLRGWDSAVGVGKELCLCAESGWTTLPTFLSLVVVVSALDQSLMDLATWGGGDGGGKELGSVIKPDVFPDCVPFNITSVESSMEFTGWVPKAAFISVVATGLCLGLATLAYVLLAGEVGIAERSLSKLLSVVELGLYVLLSEFISSVSTSLLRTGVAALGSEVGIRVQLAIGVKMGWGVTSSISSFSMASCLNLASHSALSLLAAAFATFSAVASTFLDLASGPTS